MQVLAPNIFLEHARASGRRAPINIEREYYMTKKRKVFELILGFSFMPMFLLLFIATKNKAYIGGSAFGGRIENSQYYILDDIGGFHLVSSIDWFISLVIAIFLILFVLSTILAMVYFSIKYLFIPAFKTRFMKSNNQLDKGNDIFSILNPWKKRE